MARRLRFERDGARLGGIDYGGGGPPALLLHGLAGHAGEWAETASWLTGVRRVVALDARGHGDSQRFPTDRSPAACVEDAAYIADQMRLTDVLVIGQSLGALTAMLLAAQRPDLVSGLIVAEASAARGPEDELDDDLAQLAASLRRWPVPFASRDDAVEFFGGPSLAAEAWADGLEQSASGLRPRFDVEIMVDTLRQAAQQDLWQQWERIACPALVMRAENGVLSEHDAREMVARGQHASAVTVTAAKHDLHLDRPEDWKRAVIDFARAIETT